MHFNRLVHIFVVSNTHISIFKLYPHIFAQEYLIQCSIWIIDRHEMSDALISTQLANCYIGYSWWRHQVDTFSALLAICAGNSPVTGEFPSQRLVTRSFDVFFDLRLNERLRKYSWGWWFETPSRPLWRHFNVNHPTLLPLMAWIRQTARYYLNHNWPYSMIQYGVTKDQRLNKDRFE